MSSLMIRFPLLLSSFLSASALSLTPIVKIILKTYQDLALWMWGVVKCPTGDQVQRDENRAPHLFASLVSNLILVALLVLLGASSAHASKGSQTLYVNPSLGTALLVGDTVDIAAATSSGLPVFVSA